jgi:ribonuclease VapC
VTVHLLDASAVLGWLDDDPGADVVDAALPDALISSVNFTEVLYLVAAMGSRPEEIAADLSQLGLVVLPFTAAHAARVPELKALDRTAQEEQRAAGRRRPKSLSLGDRCCLATALDGGWPVITGDRHWLTIPLGVPVIDYRGPG